MPYKNLQTLVREMFKMQRHLFAQILGNKFVPETSLYNL